MDTKKKNNMDNKDNKDIRKNVKLSKTLHNKIKKQAKLEKRSVKIVVERIIKNYFGL
tara:strand:- start:374 stop:544 length:171 start_codon:yes stop_codon:yes gene_type:complete